jgi:dTDP-4-amino-4,6-dideoxygalactose transaminase
MNRIPFNKPYLTGQETSYIADSVARGRISGNGSFTRICHAFFKEVYAFPDVLLTTSCTDALEMAAILSGVKEGDEVIIPSYTFVSTANAFVRQGATVVFADSRPDHPGMDETSLESLITPRTRAIVPVHYAGVACDMDHIMDIALRYNLIVIEDAAQAIESYYTKRSGERVRLGSIGHLATFSFHETKNIISGEGGLLVINDPRFAERAEIIWEKGTNRAAFSRGEVSKYNWIDIGSSFLPSDIIAAFLWAQLENRQQIQSKRTALWNRYYSALGDWADYNNVSIPFVPDYSTNNAHMFYLVFESEEDRNLMQQHLFNSGIASVSHYISLHSSPFYLSRHDGRNLPNSDHYTKSLLRLPMFYTLSEQEQSHVIDQITILSYHTQIARI